MLEIKDGQDWRPYCIGLSVSELGNQHQNAELRYNDWRIPYIGRLVTDEFEKNFNFEDEFLKRCRFIGIHKFQWDGYPDHVEENYYDDSNYRHFLLVELFDSGSMKGRIKTIEAHHRNYWHTDSDWHDHAKTEIREMCVSDAKEISAYCELLNVCTRSCV